MKAFLAALFVIGTLFAAVIVETGQTAAFLAVF